MHFYLLESREADLAFLQKQIVRCPATLSMAQLDSLKPGSKIVIQLSTRSKYMAVIQDMKFQMQGNLMCGFLEVMRSL
jgi:hypothetical protein